MVCQGRKRHARTQAHALVWRATDDLQGSNGLQSNRDGWSELAAFHIGIEDRTPCNQHRLLTFLHQHMRGIIKATRSQVAKWWKSQHQDSPPRTETGPVLCPSATRSSSGCHVIRRVGQGDGEWVGWSPVPLP